MKQTQLEKHYLNLSGEYGVCAELAKRGITANLTFGNYKAADIIFTNLRKKRAYTIEVKTTASNRVVTGFFQKYYDENITHPDFWVIVMNDRHLKSRFFILTHREMGDVQAQRNGMSDWHKVNGVDNVLLRHIQSYEDQWSNIVKVVKVDS